MRQEKLRKWNRLKFISFFLIAVLFLTSCTVLNRNDASSSLTNRPTQTQDYKLTRDEKGQIKDISYISAMVDIINQNADPIEVYNAIPDNAKVDLSLHDFTIYMEIIKTDQSYRVKEFSRLNENRTKTYNASVTKDMANLALIAEDTVYYELFFESVKQDLQDYSVIIGLQHTDKGQTFLSADWIKSINKLFEFSKLYFDAIAERDIDMLTWLLTQAYGQDIPDNMMAVEKIKAGLLIKYYRVQIYTPPQESLPVVLLPNNLAFMQVLDIRDINQNELRMCHFNQSGQTISVVDPYPETIKNQHLNIYYKDDFLLSWSSNGIRQEYTQIVLNQLFGEPQILQSNAYSPQEDNYKYWRIIYPEISFVVRGTADSKEKTWRGILERIEIDHNSKDISLGGPIASDDAIFVGMPVANFYKQYPFSPEAGYIIPGNDQDEYMEMVVQIDSQAVQTLIMRAVYE